MNSLEPCAHAGVHDGESSTRSLLFRSYALTNPSIAGLAEKAKLTWAMLRYTPQPGGSSWHVSVVVPYSVPHVASRSPTTKSAMVRLPEFWLSTAISTGLDTLRWMPPGKPRSQCAWMNDGGLVTMSLRAPSRSCSLGSGPL